MEIQAAPWVTSCDSSEGGATLAFRGGGEEETFLWLPVFADQVFPVFCHSGGRRYNKILFRRSVLFTLHLKRTESDPIKLARLILELADRLKADEEYRRLIDEIQQNRMIPVHLSRVFKRLRNYLSNTVKSIKKSIYIVDIAEDDIVFEWFPRLSWLITGEEKSATQSYGPTTLRTCKKQGDSIVLHDDASGSSLLEAQSSDETSKEFTADGICLSSTPSSEFHSSSSSSSQKILALFHRLHAASSEGDGAQDVFELSSVEEREEECDGAAVSLPRLHASSSSSSPEEFFPELLSAGSHEEEEEEEEEEEGSFRFQCSRPGLYQCSVTGLLFHMDGEGDVLYRTVPWNRRLLAQHHKQPAGPLFDIQCVQQCVRQLHLPHCEIHSTAAAPFLSVAHVTDEGVDFLRPQQVTETHLVLNISGFSAYGNVKEADSPPGPVRALVLLFYRPPAQEEPESVLKVLLLPRNVVLRDVLRYRKKLCPDERYLETSPHCKLQPQQEYTLSTHPEEDWILVQPPEAEFDSDGYDDYYPSFEVILERILKHLKLIVRDVNSSKSVWENRVNLRSAGVNKSCDQGPSAQILKDIRSSFIDGVSAPVLQSLLDKLLEKQVLSDSEKDEVSKPQSDRDRARYVIDVVRKKGDAASSEMIDFLCELDPFLCQHLGLS
ncbi:uncharacterized protein V6R79_026449 [Siganus canaliculatus]